MIVWVHFTTLANFGGIPEKGKGRIQHGRAQHNHACGGSGLPTHPRPREAQLALLAPSRRCPTPSDRLLLETQGIASAVGEPENRADERVKRLALRWSKWLGPCPDANAHAGASTRALVGLRRLPSAFGRLGRAVEWQEINRQAGD